MKASSAWGIIDYMCKIKSPFWVLLLFLSISTLYAMPPIKLGMSAALTGPSGKLGAKLLEGSSLYFDKLNAEGGIHGQSVEILTYDDHYHPLITVYNTTRLLHRDHTPIRFQYAWKAIYAT